MNRLVTVLAVWGVFIAAILAVSALASPPKRPSVVAAGNGGKCSLSSHQTFHTVLKGWAANSQVRVRVFFPDGTDYSHQPSTGVVVKVDNQGDYSGRDWPCWPNHLCSSCNVPDIKEGYIVQAAQQDVKRPVFATTSFRVVP